MAAPPTLAQLPVRLADLLRREVCLELALLHIEQAILQVEQEAEELKKTRPPFLFLQAKTTRNQYVTREAGAIESLAALARGQESLNGVLPRIRLWVEDDLETFLRDAQPDYVKGLATRRFPDDWQRAIKRFDQRVAGFRDSLAALQAMFGVIPKSTLLGSHAGVYAKLMQARQWGALLDYEIIFFNRVADCQRMSVNRGEETLKRVPELQFASQIAHWVRMDPATAQKAMLELRAKMELGIVEDRKQFVDEANICRPRPNEARSFVFPMWDLLRQLMRTQIDPNQVDAIVSETERMVASVPAS